MSVLEDKLRQIEENVPKVYEAGRAEGQQAEYDAFWDNYQQNGNRTIYSYAFCGEGWSEETLKPKYSVAPVDTTANSRSAMFMFSYLRRKGTTFDMTELCKKLDFSKVLSTQGMFQNANVKNITLDFSNVTTMQNCFNVSDGGNIEGYVTLTISDKCSNYSNAFNSVVKLSQLTFTDDSVIGANISFANSANLTDESIQSIINALKDLTDATAQKVTFHTNVVNRLTDEQKLQILMKNWQTG